MKKFRETRIDPLTGEVFTPKRDNQFFITRKTQVRFNNLKAQRLKKHKALIDHPMDNNRKVMKKILGGRITIQKSREFLLGAGFDFRYATHQRSDENKVTWLCVYEFQFRELQNNQYEIQLTVIKK